MENKKAVLKNNELNVEIAFAGAEVRRVTGTDGTEYMWSGNPDVWQSVAPLLFPICGGLKDDKYILEGKEYTLQKHGFTRFLTFELESSDDTSAVFLLKESENTLKQFPYQFELRVIYKLDGKKLSVTYDVKNMSADTMYFSVGAHEGYACPGGIEEYHIEFEEPQTLDSYILDGNLLEDNSIRIIENSKALPLKYEYFAVDALVFKNVNFSRASLVKNDGSRKITVDFPNHDYFLLWTKPRAEYICLEPWCGIPDGVNSDCNIKNKEGIIALKSNDTYVAQHTIDFQ